MKKVVLFAVSAALVLAFASVGMADIGHVGHVLDNAWDYLETGDYSGVADADATDVGTLNLTISIVDDTPVVEADFTEHLGSCGDSDGTITRVYAIININVEHDLPITQDLVIDFTGTPVAMANYLWIRCHVDETYYAFAVEEGIVTIPAAFANTCFSDANAFATVVDSSTAGGGGGGCNAGAVSPLMGLLALPLVWLLK